MYKNTNVHLLCLLLHNTANLKHELVLRFVTRKSSEKWRYWSIGY